MAPMPSDEHNQGDDADGNDENQNQGQQGQLYNTDTHLLNSIGQVIGR